MNAKQILAELIHFDTCSQGSNLLLLNWVKDFLRQQNVSFWTVPNKLGDKENLFATIGPNIDGGIVLSGHTDVVSVAGQDWKTNPFKLFQSDGKFYGRGACDMKGFLSTVLAMVPKMLSVTLSRPIHIALTYDEELGCLGAPGLIKEMVAKAPGIDAVIIGEPTEMSVVDMHKGSHMSKLVFKGVNAHSSMPHLGVNSVHYAAKFTTEIIQLSEDMACIPHEELQFTPNYSTLGVNLISGGTAPNIIPGESTITWALRYMPGADVDEILSKIESIIGKIRRQMKKEKNDCEISVLDTAAIPSLIPEINGFAANFCLELLGKGETKCVNFGTEAGHFQEAGFSTVICGPGSIEQAHKADEFVTIDQMDLSIGFLNNLIDKIKK